MEQRQTQPTPVRFPNLALYAVRLNNLLLNKTADVEFPLEDGAICRFHLQPGEISTQSACPISLTLELGSTTAGLWLSGWPMAEHINHFVPDGLLRELPENLTIGILENALAPLLAQAENGFGLKLNLQSTSAEADDALYTMPLGFTLSIQEREAPQPRYQGFGLLMLNPHLYPHLQERLRHWPSAANPDWEEHYTPLRLEISRIVFSMQEINNLQPSDLILLDDARFEEEGLLRLRLDSGYYCEAMLNPNQRSTLTITSEWIPMTNNEQKQNIEHISQIPVQLSFDLGEKTLSFNEVRQLHPGYVLELGKSLPEIVQIRSQHRLIGTGELVEINGRVGVRIINLFNKKAKGS